MSAVHLGVGAVCVAAVIGLLAWLETRREPNDQHFALTSELDDAKCAMSFFDGSRFRFSVRKDQRYTRTFKAPKIGFVLMRCETASGAVDAPAHFHLVNGGLADAVLQPWGVIEIRYIEGGRY
jgi:hypothetical protein